MKPELQFLLCLQLAFALSIPSCKFTGSHGTTYTCRAGSADYHLRRGLVSDNNRTTVIVLHNCRITDIDYECFDGLPATHTIDISSNKIQELKLGILDESRNVRKLNISFNNIRVIPLGLFDQMPNLEVLDARGNAFQNFELGVFDPTKNLKYLDLSGNLLTSEGLSPFLFDDSPKITYLDFSRNDMRKTPDNILNSQQALDSLKLIGCSLMTVPSFVKAPNLSTLKHLLLSENQIGSIVNDSTFRNLIGLQTLDLSGNKINFVHHDLFKPMKKISVLILRSNRIQTIPVPLFHDLRNLGNLDLSHNAIQFVADSSFQGLPRLKRLNLSINRLTYLPNKFCEELVASGTRLVKFYFNQNPWQCACLKDVLREVKRYELMYNDNKYVGKEPVCVEPEYERFVCKRTLIESISIAQLFDRTVRLNS